MSDAGGAQLCGYGCGKPWRPWAGSKLIGHARCAATPAQQDAYLARLEADPHLTQRALAAELGVSISVIRAWVITAQQRRAG